MEENRIRPFALTEESYDEYCRSAKKDKNISITNKDSAGTFTISDLRIKKVVFSIPPISYYEELKVVEIGESLFLNDKRLEHLIFNKYLKKIGKKAFQNTSLKSLEFPDSLEEIGDYAFASCPLKSVVFPDKLKKIGVCAFEDCNNIKGELVVPDSVFSIGKNAFKGVPCVRYNGIAEDENHNNWGAIKFINDKLEEDVKKSEDENRKLKEDVKKSEDENKKLKEDVKKSEDENKKLEEDVKKSEDENRKLKEDVKKSEDENRKLKEDVKKSENENRKLKEDVKKSEDENRKLKEDVKKSEDENRKLKEDVKKAEEEAKKKAEEEAKKKAEEEAKKKAEEEVKKKAEEEAKKKAEDNKFFSYSLSEENKDLVHYLYDDGVNEESFMDSYNFKEVKHLHIPAEFNILDSSLNKIKKCKISEIGESIFKDSDNLETIEFEANSIKKIGDSAFKNCKFLETIILGEGLEEIGKEAFKNCKSLKYVILPNSLKKIQDSAFENCVNLQIDIPDEIIEIGKKAFKDCKKIEIVKIPKSVKKIEDRTFVGCSSLKCLTISEGVKEIGESAFEDCSNLEVVKIPNSVTAIGDDAFWGVRCRIICSSELKCKGEPWGASYIEWNDEINEKVICSNDIEKTGNVLDRGLVESFWIEHGTTIKIPRTCTKIASKAFWTRRKVLESIIIPPWVEEIEDCAFEGCQALSYVEISNNVKNIGKHAFKDAIIKTDIKYDGFVDGKPWGAEIVKKGCIDSNSVDSGFTDFEMQENKDEDTDVI